MINDKQIRAARAILQWKIESLAEKTGLSYQSLYNIENGITTARAKNIKIIEDVFHRAGIEFLPDSGVKLLSDISRIIHGDDSYLYVLDDVFHTLRDKQDKEILFSFICDSASSDLARQAEIRLRKAGMKFRAIGLDGDSYIVYPLREYRMIPAEYFLNNAEIIYDQKVATLIDNGHGAIITHSESIAQIRKNSFNFMWDRLPMPKMTTAQVTYE